MITRHAPDSSLFLNVYTQDPGGGEGVHDEDALRRLLQLLGPTQGRSSATATGGEPGSGERATTVEDFPPLLGESYLRSSTHSTAARMRSRLFQVCVSDGVGCGAGMCGMGIFFVSPKSQPFSLWYKTLRCLPAVGIVVCTVLVATRWGRGVTAACPASGKVCARQGVVAAGGCTGRAGCRGRPAVDEQEIRPEVGAFISCMLVLVASHRLRYVVDCVLAPS